MLPTFLFVNFFNVMNLNLTVQENTLRDQSFFLCQKEFLNGKTFPTLSMSKRQVAKTASSYPMLCAPSSSLSTVGTIDFLFHSPSYAQSSSTGIKQDIFSDCFPL